MYIYRPLLHNATNECRLLLTYTQVTALDPWMSTFVDVSTERVNMVSKGAESPPWLSKIDLYKNVTACVLVHPQLHCLSTHHSLTDNTHRVPCKYSHQNKNLGKYSLKNKLFNSSFQKKKTATREWCSRSPFAGRDVEENACYDTGPAAVASHAEFPLNIIYLRKIFIAMQPVKVEIIQDNYTTLQNAK